MTPLRRSLAIALLCVAFGTPTLLAADQGTVNRMSEWTFTSAKPYADAFNDVQLDMLVTAPDGAQLRVPAFWAGQQTWRVRYASPQPGAHRWKLECSDRANPDLNGP